MFHSNGLTGKTFSFLAWCCIGCVILLTPYTVLPQEKSQENPDVASYQQFLRSLDMMEKESILKARGEFVKSFTKAPDDVSAEAYRLFDKYYRTVVHNCDMIFFWPRVVDRYKQYHNYRKDYQELLNEISPFERMVTREFLNRDPLTYFESREKEYQKGIKEKYGETLNELYEFKKCGMRFIWGEGDWYVSEDPDFLLAVSSRLKGNMQDFSLFWGEELKQRVAQDAALLLSWDELRQRIIRWETFARNHQDLPETGKKIKPELHRLVCMYLSGIDNTPALTGAGAIQPDLKKSYELFLRENTDSSYYVLITNVYDLLKKHDFRFSRELVDYLKQKNQK